MTKDNRAVKIPHSLLPETSIAVQMYQSNGGSLSPPGIFGVDPLAYNSRKLEIRQKAFMSAFSLENIFSEAANGYEQSFKAAFKFFVDVTSRLSNS